ncbi:MAG: histidine phosphatase family protein [Thermoplasmatota archaeon]
MLYIVRHGETTHNAAGIIQGPRIDSDLNETGIRQAEQLGKRFESIHLDHVYSSPLRRARDTAAALARDVPVVVAPDLHELDFGLMCGQPYQQMEPEIRRIVDAWKAGFHDERFPGGESAALAQFRIRHTAKRIHEESLESDVAVVAHGRINRVLLAYISDSGLGSLESYPQDNANITAVEGRDVIVKNDTRHLAVEA